jgi:hypothetical protein
MVVAAGALAAAFAGASTLPGQSDKLVCTGEQRWEVKTLQDEDAGQIKFTPKRISFKEILDKARADTWSTAKDDERQPDEFQVYTVRGRIPYVAREDDQDIHIEFVDVNNPDLHLVAEIPNPDCAITKKSRYKEKFRKVRNTFLNKYQDKSVYTSGIFEITGVLFHDKKNHGRGGNENGVELHPILDIKKIK